MRSRFLASLALAALALLALPAFAQSEMVEPDPMPERQRAEPPTPGAGQPPHDVLGTPPPPVIRTEKDGVSVEVKTQNLPGGRQSVFVEDLSVGNLNVQSMTVRGNRPSSSRNSRGSRRKTRLIYTGKALTRSQLVALLHNTGFDVSRKEFNALRGTVGRIDRQLQDTRAEVRDVRTDVWDLKNRVSRLEGKTPATGTAPPPAASSVPAAPATGSAPATPPATGGAGASGTTPPPARTTPPPATTTAPPAGGQFQFSSLQHAGSAPRHAYHEYVDGNGRPMATLELSQAPPVQIRQIDTAGTVPPAPAPPRDIEIRAVMARDMSRVPGVEILIYKDQSLVGQGETKAQGTMAGKQVDGTYRFIVGKLPRGCYLAKGETGQYTVDNAQDNGVILIPLKDPNDLQANMASDHDGLSRNLQGIRTNTDAIRKGMGTKGMRVGFAAVAFLLLVVLVGVAILSIPMANRAKAMATFGAGLAIILIAGLLIGRFVLHWW